MSDQILNILKYFLLALVWLFFLRVLRVVWVEMRSADATETPAVGDLSERPGVVPATGPGGRRRQAAARQAAPAPPAPAPPAPVLPAPGPPAAAPPAPTRRPTRLLVLEPADLAGRSFPLRDDIGDFREVVLGRSTGAAVSLPEDSFISARHARVFSRGGELWVEDLGSTNGTFVNSARISKPTPLQAGDRVQVGRTVFEVGA